MSLVGPKPRVLLLVLLFAAFLATAYLNGLGDSGLIGPDEPRYASIGREMARSGDWITPRLWGDPWFEKPPLLYWMIAAGYKLGLGDDLAPRVPLALLSVAYLLLQFLVLRRLDGERAACFATLMLATTAGWSTYSQIGVTDLPLSSTFLATLLFGLLWMETGALWAALAAGLCCGLALLAKGLVAGVLILPLLAFNWRRAKAWLLPSALAVLVAAPWYAAIFARFGRAFFDDFFLKHHLSRFASAALQHPQPFWFYVPVLLGLLFPWPLLLALLNRGCLEQRRHQVLAATFAFGFVFFSLSANKLPGYILPLTAPLIALVAVALDRAPRAPRLLAYTALLLGACPVVARVLPDALLFGLTRASAVQLPWSEAAYVLPLVAAVWWLEHSRRRSFAVGVLAVGAMAGWMYVKISAGPALDHLVSARGLWRRIRPHAELTCVESLHRNWRYGLNYYTVEPLPDCEDDPRPIAIEQQLKSLPTIGPRRPLPDLD